jgi:hypothetical protein
MYAVGCVQPCQQASTASTASRVTGPTFSCVNKLWSATGSKWDGSSFPRIRCSIAAQLSAGVSSTSQDKYAAGPSFALLLRTSIPHNEA